MLLDAATYAQSQKPEPLPFDAAPIAFDLSPVDRHYLLDPPGGLHQQIAGERDAAHNGGATDNQNRHG